MQYGNSSSGSPESRKTFECEQCINIFLKDETLAASFISLHFFRKVSFCFNPFVIRTYIPCTTSFRLYYIR